MSGTTSESSSGLNRDLEAESATGMSGTSVVLPENFPPECRVRKTDEYSSVFAFRRSIRGRYFVLHYRPGKDLARLGLVMAKKLARHAVTRNLLKRLAREHFRHIRASLPAHDMALRLAQKTDGATRAQLREDIASLFARLPR
ncbi:ribonuclease P protein component [Uliginosibacterium sp. H3]|uniref:Ribonuclease P protein component n=1 Tax=Uliginosibacterium silvisoli TaxID=3114758 RepID=A0ABU6K078_9RHOO|nr:ribonuclease P protein component [Uliginosibacterium sp. H3]